MVKKISKENKSSNLFFTSTNALTVVIDGESFTVSSTHKMFSKIMDELKSPTIDWGKVKEFRNTVGVLLNWSGKNFKVVDGNFSYIKDGVVIKTNPILNRIITSAYEGDDPSMYLNFFDKLLSNPNDSARMELFEFLRACTLPITSDGDFLAYKVINSDYFDKYSGKFDNHVGKTVEMERDKVCADRSQTCSSGLHFCSKDYINYFSNSEDHLVVIKINPKDVVSIPNDYNNTKGRCCKYEVVADIENWSDRIPELSEELVANYQAKMKQADEVKTSEETSDDIVEFNGSQKEFFKSWSEPRNSYTTYILHNSIGDQAYKFIGGLGQKCFKKVDMPNTIQKKAIPEFNTKQEALKNMDRVEGSQCIVKDKVFTLKRVPCSDGYARLKLVE